MRPFRTIAALAAAIVASCCWAATGMAHAVLVAAAPEDGAALEAPPAEIVLRFNEPVLLVALRVLDAAGRPVDLPRRDARVDAAIRVPLPGALPYGAYLVSWRVVSADSHPIGGSFAFSIGDAAASAIADDQVRRESAWKRTVLINRAIGDAALLLAAGGALALVLVFRGAAPRGAVPTLAIGAAVAITSAVLSIPMARGWIAAAPASALVDAANWSFDAAAPHRARVAAIALGLLCVVLGLRARQTRRGGIALVTGALIACAGVPLSGHVAALEPAWPGQVTLFLHAAGAAFWVGALPLLALAMRQQAHPEVHRLLRRFSAFALPIVAALLLAGIGVALTRLRSVDALVGSPYGQLLLAKVALVSYMLALAVANRRLTRGLAAEGKRAAARLRRNAWLEIAGAAGILVVTAWLGHTRPPALMPDGRAHADGRGFMAVEADGASVLVEVLPARAGPNRLVGRIAAKDGNPFAAQEIAIELSLPEAGIEPLNVPAARTAEGFDASPVVLLRGRWQMRVDVLVSDFEKRVFTLQLDID
jgi:copper transport protein